MYPDHSLWGRPVSTWVAKLEGRTEVHESSLNFCANFSCQRRQLRSSRLTRLNPRPVRAYATEPGDALIGSRCTVLTGCVVKRHRSWLSIFPAARVVRGEKNKETATYVEPIAARLRTGVRFPPPPPVWKPQLFSVGAFFCLMATVPACLRGFLRKPADFAGSPSGPFSATFRSLQAILLSGLARRQKPEVRRGSRTEP